MNYPGNITPQNSDTIEATAKKILLAIMALFAGGGGSGSALSVTIKPPSAGLTISDTSAKTGTWSAVQVLSDAVFTLFTGSITGYATVTYPAGTTLYGNFTAITLASGSVVAYTP